MKHALGIDIGSTTVKVTVINESHDILFCSGCESFGGSARHYQHAVPEIYLRARRGGHAAFIICILCFVIHGDQSLFCSLECRR